MSSIEILHFFYSNEEKMSNRSIRSAGGRPFSANRTRSSNLHTGSADNRQGYPEIKQRGYYSDIVSDGADKQLGVCHAIFKFHVSVSLDTLCSEIRICYVAFYYVMPKSFLCVLNCVVYALNNIACIFMNFNIFCIEKIHLRRQIYLELNYSGFALP